MSEDFPNFIRVDLYIFHNQIYLSELTFDSNSGLPYFQNAKYFNNSLIDWKRVDYWIKLNKKLIYVTSNLFQLFNFIDNNFNKK